MSNLPLNETALQAAEKAYRARLACQKQHERFVALPAAISTYLREAGFELEVVGRQQINDGKIAFDEPHQRQVGPWEKWNHGPIVQATAEETTKRIAEERDKGEVRTFRDPDSAAAYLRNEPVVQAESEEE